MGKKLAAKKSKRITTHTRGRSLQSVLSNTEERPKKKLVSSQKLDLRVRQNLTKTLISQIYIL